MKEGGATTTALDALAGDPDSMIGTSLPAERCTPGLRGNVDLLWLTLRRRWRRHADHGG
jgi:hypothetical protein